MLGLEGAGVHALAHDDARVGAELPIQLSAADVERDDERRAALEEHFGEPTGRGADVERASSFDVDTEDVQRVSELERAAADVGVVGRVHRDVRRRIDLCARFRHHGAVDSHRSGEDDGARPFA